MSPAKLVGVSTPFDIPDALRIRHQKTLAGRSWLDRLPGLLETAMTQWQLTFDQTGGLPWHTHTHMVVPVRCTDGSAAVLKVSYPCDETSLEAAALALWDGHGAVQLLHSDESLCAMVLERLDEERSLRELPLEEAISVWGALVRDLSIRPDARCEWQQLPQLAATAEQYCDELPQRWTELAEPFPRWLMEAALEVCQTRGSVARRSNNDVLVHTNLHYRTVLARPQSNAYVAIDPQAQLGDAEFAVAPCLWNRLHDLPVRGTEAELRRRASQLSQAAGLDAALAVAWSILREVDNALRYLETPGHDGEAQRSLWVASTLAGNTLPGLAGAHQLPLLY